MGRSKFPGKPPKTVTRKRIKVLGRPEANQSNSVTVAENIYYGLSLFNDTFADNGKVIRRLLRKRYITRGDNITKFFVSVVANSFAYRRTAAISFGRVVVMTIVRDACLADFRTRKSLRSLSRARGFNLSTLDCSR